MTTSISELIADRLEAMPAGERRAAHALVANYPLIGLRTVAEFAQTAGVSSPTILRFVARLGFHNYPEFQSALQEELAAQVQSPASRATGQASGAGGQAFPGVEATLENIRETFRHVSARQVADIVALLSNHKSKVFLIGGRFTDPVARYMAAHMTIIRPNVFHVFGQESNWRDQLIDMGKRDVLLIFDIRRYQDSLIRFAGKAHERGVHIVLFTDQWLSPISDLAEVTIVSPLEVASPYDTLAPAIAQMEALVAHIVSTLGDDARARIERLERVRHANAVTLDSDPQENGARKIPGPRKTPGPKSAKQDDKA